MRLTTVIFLLLLSACTTGGRESSTSENVETIHVNMDEVNPLYMSEFFSDLEYIPLQTPEDRPIGRIEKIMVLDRYIAFYDRAKKSVWVYTRNGQYVNEIDIPQGRGPGEVIHLTDVIFTEEGYVHALGAFKIVVYDLLGKFIEETEFEFYVYRFIYNPSSEEYIGYAGNSLNRGLNDENTGHNLIYFDKGGDITKSFLPVGTGKEGLGYTPPNSFPAYHGDQLFYPHMVDTIYTVEQSGVAPRYALNYGEHSIPEEVFERRQNYGTASYEWVDFMDNEITANNFASHLSFFNVTDSYIHFRFHAGENQYNAFYNKETKEVKVGLGRLTNDIDYGYVPFIYDSSDKAIYTYVIPHDLIQHLKNIEENEPEKYEDPRMRGVIELADSLTETDNPILQIATFKTAEEE